jgi:SAM-dependent methyltransferase
MNAPYELAGGHFGKAVERFLAGDASASFEVIHSGVLTSLVSVQSMWSDSDLDDVDEYALSLCGHSVIDVGAGLGRHSSVLQRRGHRVTALERSLACVEALLARGIESVIHADVIDAEPSQHDSVLVLGSGIGMFGSEAGIERFLERAEGWLKPGGRIVIESVDLSKIDHEPFREQADQNVLQGRDAGFFELRIRVGEDLGEPFDWLYIGILQLRGLALRNGFSFDVAYIGEGGRYVAVLEPSRQKAFGRLFSVFEESPQIDTAGQEANEDVTKFDELGYVVLRSLLHSDTTRLLHRHIWTQVSERRYLESDRDVPTPCKYADPVAETLLEHLREDFERVTREKLLTTYSYLRCYMTGSRLDRHVDRAACEISATLSVGHRDNAIWPIFVESRGQPVAVRLLPGDAMLYRGAEVPHWREELNSGYWIQIFLHYVRRDGPFASSHRDGRSVDQSSLAFAKTG